MLSADRNKEARDNLCAISISDDLAQEVSTQDLTDFIQDVMAARQQWLVNMADVVDMTFYAWLDEQASQLRFSLVSGCGGPLQFGAAYDDSASLEQIAQSFLDSGYHEGIPVSELMISGPGEGSGDEEIASPPFPVFIRCLHATTVH